MRRFILAVVLLGGSAALACTGAPICVPIAPGDRLVVPANAPAFVVPRNAGPEPAWLTVRPTGSDAGVRPLEPLDGGEFRALVLFAPGAIAGGELITLETNGLTCSSTTPPSVQVSVLAAAPFPTELGSVVLGGSTGFLRSEGTRGDCTPISQMPAVKRSVSVVLPEQVFPWLSVARVRLNGSEPDFGHLARSVTAGQPTFIGDVVMDCGRSDDLRTAAMKLELEIAGRAEVISLEETVELDCSAAPEPPAPGCSTAPGAVLLLGASWLVRRRQRQYSSSLIGLH